MLKKQGEASHKINKEICGLQYFKAAEDCHCLISGHWNNRVRVWDVLEIEKAEHMRSASAQEVFNEDIQCIAASEHLSLIATGSVFGKIVTWDYELFKVESVLLGNTTAIVAMHFIEKFPLLVAASQGGVVSIYTVRGGPSKLKQCCLGRFLNVNPDNTGAYVNS